MTTPTTIPLAPLTNAGLTVDGPWRSAFRSMASPVRVRLGLDTREPGHRHAEIRALFAEVERQCTRFDDRSDLMSANAAGDAWQPVGSHCFAAIEAAHDAHLLTDGVFDPRVLRTLTELGYSTSLPFAEGDVRIAALGADMTARHRRPTPTPRGPDGRGAPWSPDFDHDARAVRVGPEPIDLGGIGKGLTLRWAADLLTAADCTTFLLDAGGDCVASGTGPDGGGWRIGVEDPAGGCDPVAVLDVVDAACATSSVRLLSWKVGTASVHHLIDPRTGQPGGGDLRSVTVLEKDPAEAEVWSKSLFLHGLRIADIAHDQGLAALWVHADGTHVLSEALRPHVVWERR